MLYELSQLLDINLFNYISVRAGFAFFIAFTLTIFIMPKYLAWALSKNANQPISKYVPAHEGKRHTPTMGGLIFLAATLIAALLTVKLNNPYIWGGIITLIGFGLVGFKDDIGKVLAGDNLEGLTPKAKMLLQAVIASVATGILILVHFPTEFYVPFLKTPLFDLGYFAIPFWVLVFLSTTNAVNLTDGLDGLATVPSIFSMAVVQSLVILYNSALSGLLLSLLHSTRPTSDKHKHTSLRWLGLRQRNWKRNMPSLTKIGLHHHI